MPVMVKGEIRRAKLAFARSIKISIDFVRDERVSEEINIALTEDERHWRGSSVESVGRINIYIVMDTFIAEKEMSFIKYLYEQEVYIKRSYIKIWHKLNYYTRLEGISMITSKDNHAVNQTSDNIRVNAEPCTFSLLDS